MKNGVCASSKRSSVNSNAVRLPAAAIERLETHKKSALPNLRVADPKINHKLLEWSIWRQGLVEEIAFWRYWFETRGDQWPEDYEHKMNPATVFDPNLRRIIERDGLNEFDILDVGAGPITIMGYVWSGKKLNITAVDPLANEYNSIMDELGLVPPIKTQLCQAERLVTQFGPQRFDLVYCRNALDHSYDPFGAITQMIAVCKVGGAVVLDHYANEAVHNSYTGLHQWNFDIQGGRFVLWNRAKKIDVAEVLGNTVQVECKSRMQGRMWVLAVLKRKS